MPCSCTGDAAHTPVIVQRAVPIEAGALAADWAGSLRSFHFNGRIRPPGAGLRCPGRWASPSDARVLVPGEEPPTIAFCDRRQAAARRAVEARMNSRHGFLLL